jgi:cytochrome c-type biogenesis protein CcmH/NrfG
MDFRDRRLALKDLIDKYYRMLSHQPNADGFTILGEMLEQSGRESEAQATYRNALNLDPNQPEALRSMHLQQQ